MSARRSRPSPTGSSVGEDRPPIALDGPPLALRTCIRRLEPVLGLHGTGPAPVTFPSPDRAVVAPSDGAADGEPLRSSITWGGPGSPTEPAGEAVVQALTGLMHLHGLEGGRPRRLGLEVASVAAGVLSAQGVLASLVARSRGGGRRSLEVSVVHAALLLISQYVARATCAADPGDWAPPEPVDGPGPPLATADGHELEIETTEPEAWKGFWTALGAGEDALRAGWYSFVHRYASARCPLPRSLHATTARRTLGELLDAAEAHGVSLSRLRSYPEVLREPGLAPVHWSSLPGPAAELGGPSVPRDALPLEGLHAVELTNRVQGPLAGQLLRMLGARVTRVEPPGGDVARLAPPFAGEVGAFFLSTNRGKESVEVDLRRSHDRRALLDLVAEADVFLHNLRPDKVARHDLEHDDLASRNPGLVYCQASGWGDHAPAHPAVGMEFLVQAYAGLGNGLNPPDEPPAPSRILLVDVMGALVACEAVLGALYLRERSGHGMRVESSLLTGAMALQAHVLDGLLQGPEEGRRGGRPIWSPLDRPLETADGHLALAAERPDTLPRLRDLCGVTGGAGPDDPGIHEALRRRPAVEWEGLLLDSDIPAAAVRRDLYDLPGDPRTAPCLEPVDGAWMPRSPWRFSA